MIAEQDAGSLARRVANRVGWRESGTDLLRAQVRSVRGVSGESVQLQIGHEARERTIDATDMLVAAGRTPNTRNIGLEEAGIELDERGYIKVNDRLDTTDPRVWALGECAGSPQFTPHPMTMLL